MQHTYSLHKIDRTDNFGFSPAKYSKFKYGDDLIAKEFGNDLAEGFIENYLSKTPINWLISTFCLQKPVVNVYKIW